ncbi:nucleotidyl transferase AbiEii/AbiGii toxin family protein [Pelagicoccus enzymogenes]|uniref:nucleotidyl transferase AbiEii/AbiGii toxin family protein n=1 Tax=Pelagicoccus enzymogenes TaxID=2773457 RepID=UPI001CD6D233|nr:nucleotidyl transferase AbiEii/AbiGii toxin family protein [Pelagicoccus enzymogenes]
MLFALWDAIPNRPTRDLDLLGFLPSEADALVNAFQVIVQTDVEPDGLAFDPASITASEIREGNTFGGIRMKLIAKLGSARISIQIDVGAGDAVPPEPAAATYPALLDFPAPQLRADPVYTVIAEKLEAAMTLKEANTRMKDFFDLWFLFRRFDLDTPILQEADQGDIRQTANAPSASTRAVLRQTGDRSDQANPVGSFPAPKQFGRGAFQIPASCERAWRKTG